MDETDMIIDKFQLKNFKDLELIKNILNDSILGLKEKILDDSNSDYIHKNYKDYSFYYIDKTRKDSYIKKFLNSLYDKRFSEVENMLSKKEDDFIENYIEKNIIIQECSSDNYKNTSKYFEININSNILNIANANKREVEMKFQNYLNENFNNSFYYDAFAVKDDDTDVSKYNIEIHSVYKYTEPYLPNIIAKKHIMRDVVNALRKIDVEIEIIKKKT